MNRLGLASFSNYGISKENSNQVIGGTGFCNWYLNYCTQRGVAANQRVLNRFIIRDNRTGNRIPNWMTEATLRQRVHRIESRLGA